MKMIEIVELKVKDKTPLFLEVDVPPKCMPLLVGDPKGETLLKWVEKPSNRESVLTWGIEASVKEVIEAMLGIALDRSEKEHWGIKQGSFTDAEQRLNELGIDEVTTTNNVVHPKDPSMLGTVIVAGGKCFPVIHNASRGICVLDDY
jgi:hypothetical protein